MADSPEEARGEDVQELRSRMQSALGDLLDREDGPRVERLFSDVLASLRGRTVADRLREERGVDPGPPVDLEQSSEDEEDSSLLERLRGSESGAARYRMLGEVARGGMGVVLRVFDRELRRTLAMKVSAEGSGLSEGSERAPLDTARVARFLEEAQVTGQLDHPGVVPIHELGLDELGRVYFTMRLVRGRTLKDAFAEVRSGGGEWSRERALGALLRACEAVAYAHTKGVVHRDLKPANVMVGRFGEVYVMDWGLAKVVGRADRRDLRWKDLELTRSVHTDPREGSGGLDDSPLVTMDGAVMGTPAYMSPEQGRGEVGRIDARSDVYAFGAMLYELLAGRAPYVPADGRATPRTVLMALLDGPPRPLAQLARDAPAEVVAICERAMAREPDERYADVVELSADLRAFLEGRVVRAYRTGALPELEKWIGRNRKLATALAAVLAVALLGLGAVAWTAARGRAEVLRMADLERMRRYAAETEHLAARPENAPALQAWRERAQALADELPGHRAALAELRSRAEVAAGGELRFASDEDAWRHETLVALCDELEELVEPESGLLADLDRRLRIAGEVAERTLEAPAELWEKARRSIADPAECSRYAGLLVEPQLGLVPIGRDPDSGLWEFWVYGSGEVPQRDPSGRLQQAGEDAIVLVLLPGGVFRMGAVHPENAPDGAEPGDEDALASAAEGPVQVVALAPYFLSKYEVTQSQWRRITGGAPSEYDHGSTPSYPEYGVVVTPRNPVESVSWSDARRGLLSLGLELPTEAQWECAARAGTRDPWPFEGGFLGGELGANLASDETVRALGTDFHPHVFKKPNRLPYLDGFALHAPIGEFPPSDFGLHDLGGNVAEWCLDRAAPDYSTPCAPGDGLREGPPGSPGSGCAVRGGSWARSIYQARSAFRSTEEESTRTELIGIRAGRRLEPG